MGGNPTSGKPKIRETQNPGNSKSGKLKIRETQNPGNSKSGKLKIRGTQNLGNSKSGKLKIRELKIRESQNPGSPKTGKPKNREIHRSHVKFISFNATMFHEFVVQKEKKKTAFIDQRAVAAGKNLLTLIRC